MRICTASWICGKTFRLIYKVFVKLNNHPSPNILTLILLSSQWENCTFQIWLLNVSQSQKTRKHSSRMRTTRLTTIRVSVATRCQYPWGRASCLIFAGRIWWPCTVRSDALWAMIIWGAPLWTESLTDGQTRMKTLPFSNTGGGR